MMALLRRINGGLLACLSGIRQLFDRRSAGYRQVFDKVFVEKSMPGSADFSRQVGDHGCPWWDDGCGLPLAN